MSALPSLFDARENAAILRRIDGLRPGTPALWGKMDVAQMLAHCQIPLRIAAGEQLLKRGLIGLLFGGLARRSLAGPKPFGRGLPTAPAFVVRDARDFASEQRQLAARVQDFARRGPAGLTREPHPFFGPLTVEEWDRLQWKHLDHHLRQFGA